MAVDASQLFWHMDMSIEAARHVRRSTSPNSPQKNDTVEAEPGRTFTLSCMRDNMPTQRRPDLRWAVAHALHFFTGSEEAACLPKYNKHASRFLCDGLWHGAYGAIALRQLVGVVMELNEHPESRRAIVSMGEMFPMTINRPACWNHLQFLKFEGKLDMLVEQRSLMLHGVMEYDCVLLTNILNVVSCATSIPVGNLRWRIGSLHKLVMHPAIKEWTEPVSVLLPYDVLRNPKTCAAWLEDPKNCASGVWRDILTGENK